MTQKKAPPKISVVMATYNRAHLLPQAIRSIINQTLTDWELIIVDDASTDSTAQVAQEFATSDSRIRYHRNQRNSGLAICRNISFELARGRYIALQDDDDISLPQRLDKQARFLDRNPSIHLVGVWLRCFDSDGLTHKIAKTYWTSTAQHPPDISDCWAMPMASPCLMAHRLVFIETPMRPFFRFAEDYDFLLRCIARYNLSHIPQILYHYRSADSHHQTIMTNTLASWQHHCLAWASAYHRYKGWDDPIVNARTIDDAIDTFHPEFKTQASDGVKKLTEEFSLHLLETKQPKAIDDTKAFLSHFANKQLIAHLIDHAVAQCLFINQTDKLSTFTPHKDPIQRAKIQKHIRAIPVDQWKTQMQHCIRHNLKQDFLALLNLNHRCHNIPSLLPLSTKILFACLRRARFSFIIPYLKNLVRIKP